MGVLKPTIFCAVPRVLDRIYSGFCDAFFIQRFLFAFIFFEIPCIEQFTQPGHWDLHFRFAS